MSKILGRGAPTSTTFGILGQEYIDELTGKRYICTKSKHVTGDKAGEADHHCEWAEEGVNAGGGGIIDVTELPTENIDEKSIYRLTKSSSASVWLVIEGQVANYGEVLVADFANNGTVAHLNVELVDTIDASTMKEMVTFNEDDQSANINFYIVDNPASAENGWVYILDNVEVGPEAMGNELGNNGGWVDEPPTAEDAVGVYAVRGGNVTTYHACKGGVWVELVQKDYVDTAMSNAKTLKTKTFSSYDEAIAFIASNSIEPWRLNVNGGFQINDAGGANVYSGARQVFDIELLDKSSVMTVMMLHSIKSDYQITLSVIYDGMATTTVKSYAEGFVKNTNELTANTSSVDGLTLYYF